MEVDEDNLEEAEVAVNFIEQAGVFDKAPDVESPTYRQNKPKRANPSMPNTIFDKLVSDVAQLKAKQMEIMASHVYIKVNQAEIKLNQVDIKAKLDLVLQLEQKLLDLFQVFSKKEDMQEEHGVPTSTTDDAGTPHPPNNSKMVVYQPSPATPSAK